MLFVLHNEKVHDLDIKYAKYLLQAKYCNGGEINALRNELYSYLGIYSVARISGQELYKTEREIEEDEKKAIKFLRYRRTNHKKKILSLMPYHYQIYFKFIYGN
jgi:hypothetical protein